jgi:hypothetical protein
LARFANARLKLISRSNTMRRFCAVCIRSSNSANAQFVTGSLSGQYAAPFGDTSQYVTIGTNPSPGSASLVMPVGTFNYIGLYWGSIDNYNSITIHDTSGIDTVINATNFPILKPANGDRGLGGSAYVNIVDSFAITGVTFTSSQ